MANMVASLIHTISSHTSEVTCVAFSHDKLATCAGDKTTRLWNTDDFTELPSSPLLGHTYYVQCCVFSPFGTFLATCSTDGKLILWDLKTGDQVAVLQHPSKNSIRVCRFSPNSAYIVTGSDDNNLCLWEFSTKKLVRCYSGHEESVVTVLFTPDSNYLVSGSLNGDIRVWDAKFGHSPNLYYEPDGHDLGVTCSDVSPTYGTAGKPSSCMANFLIATGGKDDTVKLWEFTAQVGSPDLLLKTRDSLPGHSDSVQSCCFSPDGLTLASASMDKTVRIWDPIKGIALYSIEGHGRYVTCCAFSLDGQMLATGSNDKTIMVWKLTDTRPIMDNLSGYEEPPEQPAADVDIGQQRLVAIEQRTVDDVCDWLTNIGMEQYQETFRTHAIDGTELMGLKSEDLLHSLGIVPLGHRNKILRLRGRIDFSDAPVAKQPNVADSSIPDEYLCPITRELMKDPVIASDGYTYDRSAIRAWMEHGKDCSPMTNTVLVHKNLTPNRTLKMLIQKFIQGQG